MGETRYDGIIIGSGQGGTPLAVAMSARGWRVALVEREQVGGTCINWGCTPTKTMVASARVAHVAGRAGDYGVATGQVTVDLERVRERKRGMVGRFRGASEQKLAGSAGLDVIRGEARFTGERTLEVTGGGRSRTISARTVVIDTGTRPRRPRIDGLDDVEALDSTGIMELDRVPEHLLVVGGGYVGLEFAQMFRRFGAQVTIVHRGTHLLTREDADVARAVEEIISGDGIRLCLECSPSRVRRVAGDRLELELEGRGGPRTVVGSHLLLAVGRQPNTGGLRLEAAGVATDDRGHIRVNQRLETSAPGVLAIGDVTGGPAFTHISYDDFRVLRANLLEGGSASTAGRMVPYVVFIDPELGRVGLTEEQALRTGREIAVALLPAAQIARALETDETRGVLKAVVDAQTGEILGAAVLCARGGELMSIIQVAMMGGLPWQRLREGIFAHPTMAESLNLLFSRL